MKKFTFNLQSVLDLQYELEEQMKTAFGEASRKLKDEEEKLIQLMNQQKSYETALREAGLGDLDVREMQRLKHFIDVMKSRVRSQMLQVHVAEKNLEAARIKLNEAIINRKTYEKMREKAFDEYKYELAYEESKEIDQLVSYQHAVGKD